MEDENACQAEETASAKCGHSNGCGQTAGGGTQLQAERAIRRLGEGPVSRNYTEEVGKEPDYIGRQERQASEFFFNLFTFN